MHIHIAQAGILLVRDQCDSKLSLQGWLVETRERSSTIGRLHLRSGHDSCAAICILVGRAVKTSHLIIEISSEGDVDLSLASLRNRLLEGDLRGLEVLAVSDVGRGADGGLARSDLGAVDVDSEGLSILSF